MAGKTVPQNPQQPIQPSNPTAGFGHREDSEATRQGQHGFTNDTPVDLNPNAALARWQGITIALGGANFEASAGRLNALMSHASGLLAVMTTPGASGNVKGGP